VPVREKVEVWHIAARNAKLGSMLSLPIGSSSSGMTANIATHHGVVGHNIQDVAAVLRDAEVVNLQTNRKARGCMPID
jgi:hypothetical protein